MEFVKVPIFPITKYMPEHERNQIPAPMKPVSFLFGDDEVFVDKVVSCERAVSRKVGGRGFRYECKVSWGDDAICRTKLSTVWYDDFLEEWFVEVPASRAPVDWDAATQVNDIDDILDD